MRSEVSMSIIIIIIPRFYWFLIAKDSNLFGTNNSEVLLVPNRLESFAIFLK
jgi:hypothetical protein